MVTAFHPDRQLLDNVKALCSQADKVVVVDDGSGPGFEEILELTVAAGADVVRLKENSGIGAALNAGIRQAREDSGVSRIVTVDQDSILPSGYIQALLTAEAAARTAGIRPGLIGPGRIQGNPVLSSGRQNGIPLGKEPIQSGLMITTEVLDAIGDFRADLFIDLVDTEFYLRALDAGWATVLADAEFNHSLGTFVDASVFGMRLGLRKQPLRVRTAASWRYYYIFRNRVLVSRQYARRHPQRVAAGYWADFRHLAVVTLLAPGRASRLVAAAAGLRDGLLGRSGKKPGA